MARQTKPGTIVGNEIRNDGSKTAGSPPALPVRDPTNEEIRKRAYQIFLARRGLPGDPIADWLQAERELRQRAAAEAAHRERNKT